MMDNGHLFSEDFAKPLALVVFTGGIIEFVGDEQASSAGVWTRVAAVALDRPHTEGSQHALERAIRVAAEPWAVESNVHRGLTSPGFLELGVDVQFDVVGHAVDDAQQVPLPCTAAAAAERKVSVLAGKGRSFSSLRQRHRGGNAPAVGCQSKVRSPLPLTSKPYAESWIW